MSRLRREFQVIPKPVLIVAVLLLGGVVTLFTIFFDEEIPPLRVLLGVVVGSLMCIFLLLVGYVYADSRRRGMRHVMWTLIAAFVPNAIGLIVYFLMREPILTPCGKCGTAARREFAFCPDCGAPLTRVCPDCRRPVEPFWSHCAHCGRTLGEGETAMVSASATDGNENSEIDVHDEE